MAYLLTLSCFVCFLLAFAAVLAVFSRPVGYLVFASQLTTSKSIQYAPTPYLDTSNHVFIPRRLHDALHPVATSHATAALPPTEFIPLPFAKKQPTDIAFLANGTHFSLLCTCLAYALVWLTSWLRAARRSDWVQATITADTIPSDVIVLKVPSADGRCPLITSLAEVILEFWQDLPDLRPMTIDSSLEEVHGVYEDAPIDIQNMVFQSTGFRKLHLELACIHPGLEILHCVMFPDPRFDLPLFGCDIVVARGRVTAAIVDLSPLTDSQQSMGSMLSIHPLTKNYTSPRPIPDWGLSIFSKDVCFIRPQSDEEQKWFVEDVRNRLDALKLILASVQCEPTDAPSTIARYERQKYYCMQQRQNDKTRCILAKAFGEAWADRYIQSMLFDIPDAP